MVSYHVIDASDDSEQGRFQIPPRIYTQSILDLDLNALIPKVFTRRTLYSLPSSVYQPRIPSVRVRPFAYGKGER